MASQTPSNYDKWSHQQLIERIRDLEKQVKETGAQQTSTEPSPSASGASPAAALLYPPNTPEAPLTRTPYIKPAKAPAKPFDASKYSTRLIALKFAYLGQAYNGFEHHQNNKTPLPTIEEELWKALVKTRLINPTPTKKEDEGKDYGRLSRKDFDKWDREGADVNWEGCEYSKCGRTDRGVSAFGQVIGIRVRSNRPLPKTASAEASGEGTEEGTEEGTGGDVKELAAEVEVEPKAPFNDLTDELPYIQLLNRVLPPDIRVYAWCPKPPADFSARFSCKERRYKYFFTNPCFAPVPGASALYPASSDASGEPMREGWLDIDAMQQGCQNLMGLHDFRNFCKIDASKQLTNFKRRIFHASIDEVSPLSLPSFLSHAALQPSNASGPGAQAESPKMYCFTLHGSAFLWHQVRSIIAILFLIGQRLEAPSIIPALLDIEQNPTRPKYEMASDAPLVLWDCIFPAPEEVQSSEEREHGYEDRLEWVYVGDPGGVEPKSRDAAKASAIGRGKWGRGGVIDDVWELWRQHKMEETLSGLLLDTIAGQGKCTLDEEVKREEEEVSGSKKMDGMKNGPRVFDGADVGRAKGKYMPVLKRERQDPVEVVNERYAKRKGLKDEQRKPKEEDADE